jgi:hypothetical protein
MHTPVISESNADTLPELDFFGGVTGYLAQCNNRSECFFF